MWGLAPDASLICAHERMMMMMMMMMQNMIMSMMMMILMMILMMIMIMVMEYDYDDLFGLFECGHKDEEGRSNMQPLL
jgi:hypothetical protein